MPEQAKATRYLAVGPFCWAVDEDAELAVMHLVCKHLSSTYTRKGKPVMVELFHVSDDWELDDWGVKASKLEKLPPVQLDQRLIDRVQAAYHQLDELVCESLIKHEEAEEAKTLKTA